MTSRICAVVVTGNRRDGLRRCLKSILAQTRPVDRILVVDNASTDDTRYVLTTEFPQVARLDLKEDAGGAGAINAGMRWTHCNKFDWTWVMDDSTEVLPDCLERMMAFGGQSGLIQAWEADPAHPAGSGGSAFTEVRYCNFHGALIGNQAIEKAGIPDHRYFRSADDTAYGYIAALHVKSICLDYTGVIYHAREERSTRLGFYLDLRNRFLTRENLAKNGAPPASAEFLAGTITALLRAFGAAIESPDRVRNIRAAIDGLRDGLYSRFDRLPAA